MGTQMKHALLLGDGEDTREAWLVSLANHMRPVFAKLDAPLPEKLRVSMSITKSAKTTGMAFAPEASGDGTVEVLIRLDQDDPMHVAAVLVHNLIHAHLLPQGVEGHNITFRRLSKALGFEKKCRLGNPGPGFFKLMAPILVDVGPFPHKALDFSARKTGKKEQKNRHVLVQCGVLVQDPKNEGCKVDCEVKARMARSTIDKYGAVICPVHHVPLMAEPEEEDPAGGNVNEVDPAGVVHEEPEEEDKCILTRSEAFRYWGDVCSCGLKADEHQADEHQADETREDRRDREDLEDLEELEDEAEIRDKEERQGEGTDDDAEDDEREREQLTKEINDEADARRASAGIFDAHTVDWMHRRKHLQCQCTDAVPEVCGECYEHAASPCKCHNTAVMQIITSNTITVAPEILDVEALRFEIGAIEIRRAPPRFEDARSTAASPSKEDLARVQAEDLARVRAFADPVKERIEDCCKAIKKLLKKKPLGIRAIFLSTAMAESKFTEPEIRIALRVMADDGSIESDDEDVQRRLYLKDASTPPAPAKKPAKKPAKNGAPPKCSSPEPTAKKAAKKKQTPVAPIRKRPT